MKGCDYVRQYNLLDEPWISVVVDKKGNTENVSLIQVFTNAHRYSGLAGDTKTQDFAVLRVLLAVLHTVFSRFDEEGEVYEVLDLDEKWIPREEVVDEDDAKAYREAIRNLGQSMERTVSYSRKNTRKCEIDFSC